MTEQEWAFVKKSGTAEFSSSLYAQGLLRKEAFFINCLNAPSGKDLAMKNYQKYSKQYFAPNGVTMDWTKKEAIFKLDDTIRSYIPSKIDTSKYQSKTSFLEYDGKKYALTLASSIVTNVNVILLDGKSI